MAQRRSTARSRSADQRSVPTMEMTARVREWLDKPGGTARLKHATKLSHTTLYRVRDGMPITKANMMKLGLGLGRLAPKGRNALNGPQAQFQADADAAATGVSPVMEIGDMVARIERERQLSVAAANLCANMRGAEELLGNGAARESFNELRKLVTG